MSRSVRAGDDVFIWLAQGGLKAHCRATADAKIVDADTWLPWPPKAEGRYVSVIPIEVLVELPEPIERSWTEIKKLVGVTSSPQFFPKVDGTGLQALRGLFTCSIGVDISFLPALDLEYLGQDHRHVANRAIAYRRGQSAFRNDLLRAYSRRCAVTGSALEPVLEAAHIAPYRGEHTNRVDNGLLLRSDVHTLFDLELLTVLPTGIVRVHPDLHGTDYDFNQRRVELPAAEANRSHADLLRWHNEQCAWLTQA